MTSTPRNWANFVQVVVGGEDAAIDFLGQVHQPLIDFQLPAVGAAWAA